MARRVSIEACASCSSASSMPRHRARSAAISAKKRRFAANCSLLSVTSACDWASFKVRAFIHEGASSSPASASGSAPAASASSLCSSVSISACRNSSMNYTVRYRAKITAHCLAGISPQDPLLGVELRALEAQKSRYPGYPCCRRVLDRSRPRLGRNS